MFRFLTNRLLIIDRYLFSEFINPFILAVCGFGMIAVVDILMYLVELAVISGIGFDIVIRILVYKLPAIMVLFFPMAVLFTVMLILVRMAKDNEITVLRASGINTFRFIAPIILMSFLVCSLSYFTNEKLVPWTNKTSDKLIRHEVTKKPPPHIAENTVFKGVGERYFYVKKVNYEESSMEHVMIFEATTNYPRIITSKFAEWSDLQWILLDGKIYDFNRDGTFHFLDTFHKMQINVNQNIGNFYSNQQTAREMDSKTLKEKIRTLKAGGVSTRALKVEYHMKKSVPVACFIFGILGISYCLIFISSGKDWWGVIISICLAVLSVGFYFFIMSFCRALAKDGSITPFLGAWLPNMSYGSICCIVIFYQSKFR